MQRGRGVHVNPFVHQPQCKIAKLGTVNMAAEVAVICDLVQISKENLEHRIHTLNHNLVPIGQTGDPRHLGRHLLAQVFNLAKACLIVG